jgi:hypothetical protein
LDHPLAKTTLLLSCAQISVAGSERISSQKNAKEGKVDVHSRDNEGAVFLILDYAMGTSSRVVGQQTGLEQAGEAYLRYLVLGNRHGIVAHTGAKVRPSKMRAGNASFLFNFFRIMQGPRFKTE